MNQKVTGNKGKPARWLLLLAAILFVVIGVNHHETQEVLTKAIHICMECIGIG